MTQALLTSTHLRSITKQPDNKVLHHNNIFPGSVTFPRLRGNLVSVQGSAHPKGLNECDASPVTTCSGRRSAASTRPSGCNKQPPCSYSAISCNLNTNNWERVFVIKYSDFVHKRFGYLRKNSYARAEEKTFLLTV